MHFFFFPLFLLHHHLAMEHIWLYLSFSWIFHENVLWKGILGIDAEMAKRHRRTNDEWLWRRGKEKKRKEKSNKRKVCFFSLEDITTKKTSVFFCDLLAISFPWEKQKKNQKYFFGDEFHKFVSFVLIPLFFNFTVPWWKLYLQKP